jgi:ABC-type oligopeptide transport system ATPase subunit
MIPGKTKVDIELFKGVSLSDIAVGGVAAALVILAVLSSLPGRYYVALAIALLGVGLLVRMDTVPNYVYLLHIIRHCGYDRHFKNTQTVPVPDDDTDDDDIDDNDIDDDDIDDDDIDDEELEDDEEDDEGEKPAKKSSKKSKKQKSKKSEKSEKSKNMPIPNIMAFTDIEDGFIKYGSKYYGAVIEIPPVEFRFFSAMRRKNSIESGLGRVLRSINPEFSANIVKIERPIIYDDYLRLEYGRVDSLRASYESGLLSEEEYKARIEILYDRIHEIRRLCFEEKVIEPFYYVVLFESDKHQLNNQIESAVGTLRAAEMKPRRLNSKELAVFLRYTNEIDFDEREIENVPPEDYAKWAMPQSVEFKARTVEVNNIITHNMRVVTYPTEVGDAWLASVMSIPGTKVVVKCRPMERSKAIRVIDRSLQELRGQYMATGVDSRRIEIQSHMDTLGELLATLQGDNETLLEANVYVTAYDIALTRATTTMVQPPKSDRTSVTNMKKTVRRYYQEGGFRLNNMEFDQMQAFIGSQVSGYDPMLKQGRGIPSNSLAACYPWIFAHVSDKGGIKLGSSQGVPVFIDFFRRDSERVNSNMVIVGKSGSGKSYAAKSLLTNLAADDCKIFILDPENEYTELAENLHGKFINVGNAQYGRLNPFQIITALDDDEVDGASVSGSYATHLQFLEEFFRQILPDCDKDAMEYLNSLIDRMYTNHGITAETDLRYLRPEDYPVFDDLYDTVLSEFQRTDNEYIRTILRTLMNYVAKFAAGGRNANIWNGPSTITTDENFTVFNFQSLISNRNNTIGNAQMLLVLKYIDNEIIKNRDYNTKYGLNRKIVVVIDEAHVFIDTKFPVALDFMFQLAKRIRKYNGMQIVITQNIKDFVGSEEIARKSTAIINACQYSFIFALAPNDIQDLCKLYEKAGGINEVEQEQITTAPRGQAFTVMSPSSRSTFRVEVPKNIVSMFHDGNYQTRYFAGEDGDRVWEDIVSESRKRNAESRFKRWGEEEKKEVDTVHTGSGVSFVEVTEETDTAPEQPRRKSTVMFEEEAPSQRPAASKPTAGTSAQSNDAFAELLSRFSYDALVHEIQRSVEDTINNRLKSVRPEDIAQPTQPAAQPETEEKHVFEPAKPEPVHEQPVEEKPKAVELFTAEPEEETPVTEPVVEESPIVEESTTQEAPTEEPSTDSTDSSDGDDILAFMRSSTGEIDVPTPIETMEIFDEDVVDVSLDDLIRYNQKKRKTGTKKKGE